MSDAGADPEAWKPAICGGISASGIEWMPASGFNHDFCLSEVVDAEIWRVPKVQDLRDI